MATAGVIIASAVGEEDATVAAAVETAVDVFMQLIVEVGHRQHARAAVAGRGASRMPQQRVVARRMVPRMPQRRAVARRMVPRLPQRRAVARPMLAVADRTVAVARRMVAVADRTVAANTISQ
jgi:hypothetical protein